jgi:hypothetical protein
MEDLVENLGSPKNPKSLGILAVKYIEKNLNSLHDISSWRLSNAMDPNNPSCLIKYQRESESWPIWSHGFP